MLELIQSEPKPSFDIQDPATGETVIHNVLRHDKSQLLKAMVGLGASLDIKTKEGLTPILFSITNSHSDETIEFLAKHTQNIDLKDNEGHTALILACRRERPRVLNVLIQHGASIDAQDNKGRTPVAIAVELDSAELLKLLVDAGANVDIANREGLTPLLHSVVNMKSPEVISILIEKSKSSIDEKYDGHTAAQLLCKRGDVVNVSNLLMKGADGTVRDKHGNTMSLIAICSGNVDMLAVVGGQSADIASGPENLPPILFLLRKEPTTANFKGWPNEAGINLQEQLLAALLPHLRTSANVVDNTGRSAILYAASRSEVNSFRIMLNAAVKFNAAIQDNAGDNCYHLACRNGCKEIVDMMLHASVCLGQFCNL